MHKRGRVFACLFSTRAGMPYIVCVMFYKSCDEGSGLCEAFLCQWTCVCSGGGGFCRFDGLSVNSGGPCRGFSLKLEG